MWYTKIHMILYTIHHYVVYYIAVLQYSTAVSLAVTGQVKA